MKIEKYIATVTANQDEEKRGGIKVACAQLLGDEDSELPVWVYPKLQWGWFVVPDVGELVEIEVVTGGDADEIAGQGAIEELDVCWTGARLWTTEETESPIEARPVPEDFTSQNYGKRRGLGTPAGHVIMFDDTDGKEKITISFCQKGQYQFLSFDETGGIIIQNIGGTMIFMDTANKALTLIDQNSNLISMDESGIKLVDRFGGIFEMKDGVTQILAKGNVTVCGNVADIKTGTINLLNGATQSVVLGDLFKSTVFDIHTHATAFGPSGPPVPLLLPTVLSANCKVGP